MYLYAFESLQHYEYLIIISVHVQLYTTCIELAANEKHTENFNFCMTFVLCIYAIYYKYYSTAQGLHSTNLYRF